MMENNNQLNQRISLIITDIDRVSSLSVIDDEAQRILSKNYKTYGVENLTDREKMINLISISSTLSTFFYEVIYVSQYEMFYTNLSSISQELEDRIINEWIPYLTANGNKRMITDIYQKNTGVAYISINRRILNPYSYKVNGYVFINIRQKDLQRNLDKTNRTKKDGFITNTIILSENNIIYHSKDEDSLPIEFNRVIFDTIKNNWESIEKSRLKIEFEGNEYIMTGIKNEDTGWYIIQYIPMKYIANYSKKTLYFYLFIMLPILSLFLLLGYYFSERIVSPVHKLKCAMKKVENGIFEQLKDKSKKANEIDELIESYNTMVIRLEKTIRQKYISEMNKRTIEFKMLQAQINPHFLYNTLNLITSMAELEGNGKIGRVSNSLARMFRYNIQEGDIVRIKQELEQVSNYVTIQKLRFYDKVEFCYEISEEIESYYMLKFLFQPLIENAIFHGIENKDGPGKIDMIFKEEQEMLIIKIIDDGVGMSEDTYLGILEKITRRREEYFKQERYDHIGIENIHCRIRDYYGEEFGLHIESILGEGTIIEMKIPIVKEMK
jgi:two-component system sensor histidine kinase YesM